MITSISGRVLEIGEDCLVIEMSGVGLKVFVPAQSRDHIHSGSHVFLHTYMLVREDLLALYGFETKEALQVFTLLMGVNGVGPRLALSVLSTLSPDVIRSAVFHNQLDVFNRVPGVGRKTAQKILLHLQDRIPVGTGLEQLGMISEIDSEVLTALTTLGYSVVEAQAALQSIPKDASQQVEDRLRLALQYFTKP